MESDAKITDITEISVGRNTGDDAKKFPYRIYFIISAQLNDITGVTEWGVYMVDAETNDPIEFGFKNVSGKGTQNLYLNTISGLLHTSGNMSYIEATRRIGLYVKKKGKKGDLQTLYGELKTYTVRYDFPSIPSVTFSNPQIVCTEIVSVPTEGGTASKRMYKTTYSYELTVKGSIWVDYLEDQLSLGWQWNNESHFYRSDGTYTLDRFMTYNGGNLVFSQWTVIHCTDGQTIESSNWLNLSGDSTISKIDISDYERF